MKDVQDAVDKFLFPECRDLAEWEVISVTIGFIMGQFKCSFVEAETLAENYVSYTKLR